jgi:hypothetical protein
MHPIKKLAKAPNKNIAVYANDTATPSGNPASAMMSTGGQSTRFAVEGGS